MTLFASGLILVKALRLGGELVCARLRREPEFYSLGVSSVARLERSLLRLILPRC